MLVKPSKPLTLFKLVQKYRNYGVGMKVTRTIWNHYNLPVTDSTCHYEITNVYPNKKAPGTGVVFGIKTFQGTCFGSPL